VDIPGDSLRPWGSGDPASRSTPRESDTTGRLAFGELVIDLDGREVRVDGEPVALTRTQYDILIALAAVPGRVVRRQELMEQVWGHAFFADPDLLSVHVHHIRRALGDDSDGQGYIQTVRGVGYKFVAPPTFTARRVALDFDADSILLSVNPHEPFLGWHPDDIVGKYFSPAGLSAQSSREVLAHVAAGGGVAGHLPMATGDSGFVTVFATISVDMVDGEITGYRGVIDLPD